MKWILGCFWKEGIPGQFAGRKENTVILSSHEWKIGTPLYLLLHWKWLVVEWWVQRQWMFFLVPLNQQSGHDSTLLWGHIRVEVTHHSSKWRHCESVKRAICIEPGYPGNVRADSSKAQCYYYNLVPLRISRTLCLCQAFSFAGPSISSQITTWKLISFECSA